VGCIPYQSTADAERSLRGSIILFEGKPVWVERVRGPDGHTTPDQINIDLVPLPFSLSNQRSRVTLDDLRIDISNIRLGMVNIGDDAVWCERTPHRGTIQGLYSGNVNMRTIQSHDRDNEPHAHFDQLTTTDALGKFCEGSYPSVQEIVAKFEANSEFRSAAFSRCFALSKDPLRGDYIVVYKGFQVGFGNVSQGISLAKRYNHLREQLEELGIRVG
jgi:hypothetical protein